MKPFLQIILIALTFVSFESRAQITITLEDLPTIGTQIIEAVDNTTQVDPGNPGLNQAWDFTNLIPATYDTTLYLPTQGLHNNQAYPDANAAISHRNGNLMPYYDYEYIQYGDDGIRFVGDEDMLTIFGAYTIAIHINCNPYPVSLPLPFYYGKSLNQTSNYTWYMATRNAGVLLDSIMQISHLSVSLLGDAAGIMSTPYSTFPVLRVREDIVSVDSVYNWENGWVFDRTETNTYSTYRWYTNDFYLVGELRIEDGKANGISFFKSEAIVGNSGIAMKEALSVYPNPASDLLNIQTKNNFSTCKIMSLDGRVINEVPFSTVISTGFLAPGVYILRLESEKEFVSARFIKY